MGRSIIQFSSLVAPFSSVLESYVVIPPGEILTVESRHRHRLVFFINGGLNATSSSGDTYQLHPGDALLVGKSQVLRYQAAEPGREVMNHVLVLRLTDEISGAGKRRSGLGVTWDTFLDALAGQLRELQYYPRLFSQVGGAEIIHQMRREMENPNPASVWRISGFCLSLISGILGEKPESEEPSFRPRIHRGAAAVEHACQFIRENFHQKLDLDQIAWQVQLSGEHLERLFRKHNNQTVFQYLKEVRLNQVCQLLLTSELPVSHISRKCGYSTPNLLYRHFKAYAGMTPVEYRLEGRKNENFLPSKLASSEEG